MTGALESVTGIIHSNARFPAKINGSFRGNQREDRTGTSRVVIHSLFYAAQKIPHPNRPGSPVCGDPAAAAAVGRAGMFRTLRKPVRFRQ